MEGVWAGVKEREERGGMEEAKGGCGEEDDGGSRGGGKVEPAG